MILENTISRNELTMMNAPKKHSCKFLPYGVKIEALDTEGGLTWFLTISLDENELEEFSNPIFQCAWCPEQLIDYSIINLRGPHPPNNKGEYLCNGNCNWEDCGKTVLKCSECGYLSCDSWKCGENFDSVIHQLLNLKFDGDSFCRNCLCWNTEEYI